MLREGPAAGKEKRGIALLALAALLAAGLLWFALRPRATYGKAAVSYNGERVALLDLADYTDPVRIDMAAFGVDVPLYFELKDHRIRFVDVDCPDKLCEGFGFIGQPLQTAVCMPNRVSVLIVDP